MSKPREDVELLYELGTVAAEHARALPFPPRAYARVREAEQRISQVHAEIDQLDEAMNREDTENTRLQAELVAERAKWEEVVERWRPAVDAVKRQTRALRKELASSRGQLRYDANQLAKLEQEFRDLEDSGAEEPALSALHRRIVSRRLALMRRGRELEDRAAELQRMLEPEPGRRGAQGIAAYRHLVELEQRSERQQLESQARLERLDAALAQWERERDAAQALLDEAILALGEAYFTARVADPALTELVAKLAALGFRPAPRSALVVRDARPR